MKRLRDSNDTTLRYLDSNIKAMLKNWFDCWFLNLVRVVLNTPWTFAGKSGSTCGAVKSHSSVLHEIERENAECITHLTRTLRRIQVREGTSDQTFFRSRQDSVPVVDVLRLYVMPDRSTHSNSNTRRTQVHPTLPEEPLVFLFMLLWYDTFKTMTHFQILRTITLQTRDGTRNRKLLEVR